MNNDRKAREIARTQPERVREATQSRVFVIQGEGGMYVTTILVNVGRGLARHLRGTPYGGVCTCHHARENIDATREEGGVPFLRLADGCWHIKAAVEKIKMETEGT